MSSPLDMRTMNNGGVVEAVNIALAKVADNIADVNTPPDKPRTVTLKITFKPDESRTLIASKAVVTTNLQPQEPQTIPVVLDKLDGAPMLLTRGVLYTAITRARELFILVGDEEVVARMTANNRQQRRYSGLRYRLAETI